MNDKIIEAIKYLGNNLNIIYSPKTNVINYEINRILETPEEEITVKHTGKLEIEVPNDNREYKIEPSPSKEESWDSKLNDLLWNIGLYDDKKGDDIYRLFQKMREDARTEERERTLKEIENLYYDQQAEGCGLEDNGITDRYEAMEYGWDRHKEAVDECLDNLNK